jgi:hypothetical protein
MALPEEPFGASAANAVADKANKAAVKAKEEADLICVDVMKILQM